MRKIFKYSFAKPNANLVCEITMPAGAEVLRAAIQNDEPTLWALVYTLNPVEVRRFTIYATGQSPASNARHISTFDDGALVWHAFELLGEPLPDGLNLPEDAENAYRTMTAAGFVSAPAEESFARAWIAPDDEPLTTELIMAVATLQEHGFGPVVSK